MKRFFLALLIARLTTISTSQSYDGHEVLRVKIMNPSDKNNFRIIVDEYQLDVWGESWSFADVQVPLEEKQQVREALAQNNLQYDTMIQNIGDLIREEEAAIASRNSAEFSLNKYQSLENIEAYLDSVAASNDNASLISIGETVEGRDIWQLKFSDGSSKPALWVDCNIHAREWITGTTCLYGVDLLSTSYGSNPNVTALLDKYDVYIIPIINPDGYAYTSNDRLWRKNRRRSFLDLCNGVDLNRNFNNHFGGPGTSAFRCDQTYRGPSAASEPETQAIQNAILDLAANADLKVLYSIHSYSQLWMYPYGWTDALPQDEKELKRVAEIGVKALTAVHGTQYKYGPIYTTIYPAASTTVDFAYDNGVTYSYTLELRDTGEYGFLLPEDQIIPTAEETWAGLIAATLATPNPV